MMSQTKMDINEVIKQLEDVRNHFEEFECEVGITPSFITIALKRGVA